MTSPDRQIPFGSLAPDALSTLQDLIASPIGEEATEVLGTLAEFGDSLVARFFQGYTSITDVFAHAFDELGAELGGIPGMSGVTVWVQSIEELVGTAMGLIDGVFDGIQAVVDGLSFAVTGNGIEGNIAEGMNAVVEGLTMFLKLVNLAMDLIQELIDGVLGVAGGTMSQLVQVLSWVIGVANQFLLFFHGIYDVFGDLLDFAPGGDRPLEALLAGLPKLLSVFSDLDAGKLIGEIPTALLQGVQDAIDGVSDFLQDLVNAILRAIKGIPVVGGTLADIIAEVGGLNDRAVEAKTDAAVAKAAAQSAVQTTGITTSGTMGDLKWTRLRFTGDGSWVVPSPSTGFRFERFDWQLTGAGCGGARPKNVAEEQMPEALPGGFIRRSFTPAEIGSPGTVFNLTIPAGAPGASSTGLGGVGARAVVRRAADNSVLVDSGEPGTSGIYTTAGIPSTDQRPGAGGRGACGAYREGAEGQSGTYVALDNAGAGQPSLAAPGGTAGHPGGGWFGGGAVAPGAGTNAPTTDPFYAHSGSGGGSGAFGTQHVGGKGGDPGGAGGVGSPSNGGLFNSTQNGGPGGRAEIVIWIVEAPL